MTENIYAPPQASLEVAASSEQRFYVVAPRKFWVLFVVTLGAYSFYWHYRNWKLFKLNVGADLWPLPRSIFSIFFTHSLFRFVDEQLNERQIYHVWNPSGLATQWVWYSILSNGFDRLSARSLGSPVTDILSMAFVPVMGWVLYRAQIAINASERDPDGSGNQDFTGVNVLWILLGVVIWILVLIGLFVPEEVLRS